jgi:hypothetical protein
VGDGGYAISQQRVLTDFDLAAWRVLGAGSLDVYERSGLFQKWQIEERTAIPPGAVGALGGNAARSTVVRQKNVEDAKVVDVAPPTLRRWASRCPEG